MPQSWSIALPRHQKKERRGKQMPDMKPQAQKQRRTATEEPHWIGQQGNDGSFQSYEAGAKTEDKMKKISNIAKGLSFVFVFICGEVSTPWRHVVYLTTLLLDRLSLLSD